MTTVNSMPWIDSDLYNKFPDVYSARNTVDEKTQIAVGKALINSIPELKNQIGIGITHSHWTLNSNEHIIGHLKEHTLYSKPQVETTNICPTALVATKDGLVITEAVDNPSLKISEAAKKIHDFAKEIFSYLPIEEGEEFSKFVVMVNQQITNDIDADCFLETNSNKMSVLTPITEGPLEEDTILTSVTVNPDEEGIRQVRCRSLCLGRGSSHISSHAYDPEPKRGTDMAYN